MKTLYWIDSFEDYPSNMTYAIGRSLEIYRDVYPEYTKPLGYQFCLVRLEDLSIETTTRPAVRHGVHGDLLQGAGAAYVGLIHPDRRKEEKLATIYALFAGSEDFVLLNLAPDFPMVCKDKSTGISIAGMLGLAVLPTSLVPEETEVDVSIQSAETFIGGYPMFIRPADLTAGLGKRLVRNREALRRYLERPPFPGRRMIVQPAVSIVAEYRVYLETSKIVACRLRRPLTEGESCDTPRPVEAPSRLLAEYLKTAYLCVDWIWNGSTFWFCEFELGGGFTELGEPDRARVASAFFKRLVPEA